MIHWLGCERRVVRYVSLIVSERVVSISKFQTSGRFQWDF